MIGKTFWTTVAIMLVCCAATAADIRRVVTALGSDDKAIALFDTRMILDAGSSGTPSVILWATDSAPAALSFNDDNAAKPLPALPPDTGTALLVVEFPPLDPAVDARMDPNFMMKVIGDRAPARGLPVRHPLMHRTRTVDYAVVLSGEIDMMLDDTVIHIKSGWSSKQLIMPGSTGGRSHAVCSSCWWIPSSLSQTAPRAFRRQRHAQSRASRGSLSRLFHPITGG